MRGIDVPALVLVFSGILCVSSNYLYLRNTVVVLPTSSPASKAPGVKLPCARYHERQWAVVAATRHAELAGAGAADVPVFVRT